MSPASRTRWNSIESDTKMKKSSSFSRLVSNIKPSVLPKPPRPSETRLTRKPEVATKPDRHQSVRPAVAPKPQKRQQRPAVPPKPANRRRTLQSVEKLETNSNDVLSLGDKRKMIRTPPKQRSTGRLPKPKTPGWTSPNEDMFRRPVNMPTIPNTRRTSVYQKRLGYSLLDNGQVPLFSPSKTRRRSVYGALPRSPPKTARIRRSSLVPSKITSPTRDDEQEKRHSRRQQQPFAPMQAPALPPINLSPVVLLDPLQIQHEYILPSSLPEAIKPAAKKRRPVCGVAALRRQSLLPENLPPPMVRHIENGKVEVEAKIDRMEIDLDKSVEIVDMPPILSVITPPRHEPGDCEGDFFTPAGKFFLNTSLYETPAIKIKAQTPARLAQSVNWRHHRTPGKRSKIATVGGGDYDTQTMVPEVNTNNLAALEELDEHEDLKAAMATPNVDKNDSSRCVVS